ncbi:MAG TPA: ATP-binding cassette domain-containing protein [Candidatus Dormibacteraeota bacterium]|nr:ATP-binding cassette domain-containing protein [Candidatus Dormibacteraeota bacterium]
MAAISARNLSFKYAGAEKPSMEGVTFSIEKGKFVILTGPSGCGKTTLCRCLNGLIPNFYSGQLTGELEVDGVNVKGKATAELATHVGFVFQNPENQLFSLSVERDVGFGLENLGVPREQAIERVQWAMRATGVFELRDKAPHELSGGQQQRAAIAGILAMRPNILVLDEPTSFLDPKSAEEIVSVIAKLGHDLGLTIVLVEHRLDIVSRYADRVMVMDGGKIQLDGSPREVYNEQARLIGIGLPRVTMLAHLLRKEGFNLLNPVTVEEATSELRGLLNT